MCVGTPAKVLSIHDSTALVSADGAQRTVSAALLDTLDPGDYVMVHAGLAIAKITSDDQQESQTILDGLTPKTTPTSNP